LVDNYNPPKVITQTALWGYAARDAQFQIHAASILPVGDGVCCMDKYILFNPGMPRRCYARSAHLMAYITYTKRESAREINKRQQ
jgi:hypothetical protein